MPGIQPFKGGSKGAREKLNVMVSRVNGIETIIGDGLIEVHRLPSGVTLGLNRDALRALVGPRGGGDHMLMCHPWVANDSVPVDAWTSLTLDGSPGYARLAASGKVLGFHGWVSFTGSPTTFKVRIKNVTTAALSQEVTATIAGQWAEFFLRDGDVTAPGPLDYTVEDTLALELWHDDGGGLTYVKAESAWTLLRGDSPATPPPVGTLGETPARGTTINWGNVTTGTTKTLYTCVVLQETGGVHPIQLQGAVYSGETVAGKYSIVTGDPTAEIGAGMNIPFDIRFNAAGLAPGVYISTITFTNNSAEGNPYYELTATVVAE